jgi:hypothetical protein
MTHTTDQADSLETLAIKQIRELVIEPVGDWVLDDQMAELSKMVIEPIGDWLPADQVGCSD